MSSNSPTNPDNQEIDLAQVSRKLSHAYENFLSWIFRGFLFIKRNIIILAVLFIVGAGLGFYLDKTTTVYNHEIIIKPNFGSTEYTYSKINLTNSKIKEKDFRFLKSIGIKNPILISEVEIEPISDIYEFVNAREQNFELVKLMAENGDLNKIIEDETTSKNYTYHKIKITTNKAIDRDQIVEPLLNYLNKSEFYSEIQKTALENIRLKIESDKSTIKQIDDLLTDFSSTPSSSSRSDKLVYYENTQLNDILKTKNELVLDQGSRMIELAYSDKIVKENSEVLNIKNTKSLNGKMKFIIPFFLMGAFFGIFLLRKFYKSQMEKLRTK
ncbi:MAG: hypothetical protein JNM71_06845 [Flavobacterium lindanitolerans]|uniref:hypothetical protein n=1 Tax=Flavobacterium lindanitolerans TaxID=428988 RepID=UPI001A4BE745|nr:hypothetical protein [Flavobacterium lindanitolerans]MBL7867720.1 hypothetical protein [Flavobacterium lindanitolerans]